MRPFIEPVYYHAYQHHGTMTDWVTHTVMSVLIHSVIYSLTLRIMRQLTTPEGIFLAGTVLVGALVWARRSDQRR